LRKFILSILQKYFSYFLFYYRILRWRIGVLLVISTAIAVLDGLGLSLFIPLFQLAESDAVTGEGMGKLDFVVDFFDLVNIDITVASILLFLFSLFALKGVAKYFERLYAVILRTNFMKKLRIELVNGLAEVSYPGFLNLDAGRLQNVIVAEIGKAVGAFSSYFTVLQQIVLLTGYLLLAFLANWQFAILITVAGALTNFIYRYINKKVEKASYSQSLVGHGLQSKVIQSVSNFKYLKATGLMKQYKKNLIDLVNEAEDLSLFMGRLNAFSMAIKEPLTIGVVAVVIYIQVGVMETPMTSIILSLIFFQRALGSIMQVQATWQQFLTNSGGVKTVNALYDDFKAYKEPTQSNEIPTLAKELRFDSIYFKYQTSERWILDNIQLTIPKNQTIAFVGESGSGKTTLVNLLAGLLQPDKGHLILDGTPLTVAQMPQYRNQIGYITQEPVVFSDTVYNNVTFWAPKTPENLDRFEKIMAQAALTDFLKQLPNGIDSQLGDNGIMISGGQKQRISIARELYRNSSILLMDEATSALDSETEKFIQENIDQLKGTVTLIIIAHRLSTIKNADVIYLMDKGAVVGKGTFDELTVSNERFAKMVKLQEF
jgi:ABC-type multidrug transport system fused ATPase/permease subunit